MSKVRSIYRIYTEDKNRKDTIKLMGDYFTNFTILHGSGYWHGELETTIVFEIVDDGQRARLDESVKAAAAAILTLNNQASVLVTEVLGHVTEYKQGVSRINER